MGRRLVADSVEETSVGTQAGSFWELDLRGRGPDGLATVRRWAGEKLRDLGEDHRQDVLMVAVELVTNALDHGEGARTLRLSYAPGPCVVGVEVEDGTVGDPTLGRSRFGAAACRGRGLVLVDRLTDGWGTTSVARGKIVWARLSCPDSPCRKQAS